MTPEPENKKRAAVSLEIKRILKSIARSLTRNWGWKLLSLLIAIVLWGGLISQDTTLTREKVFSDVTVSVSNEDALLRSGLIVVDGLENLGNIRMSVDVPQNLYSAVTASNYNVRVDLSRIRASGVQELQILTTSSTAYGTVKELSISHITVTVEEYVTRSRIPVRLSVTGEAPSGMYAKAASVDPAQVTIAGPKSLVSGVVRCVVEYDMSVHDATPGTDRASVPFTLTDLSGEKVESSLISVMTEGVLLDSVIVEQTLFNETRIALGTLGIVGGAPADGYEVKSVTTLPETLVVAGTDTVLNNLNFQYLKNTVDITGATGTITRAILISTPADAEYVSSDVAYVTVEIGPIKGGE